MIFIQVNLFRIHILLSIKDLFNETNKQEQRYGNTVRYGNDSIILCGIILWNYLQNQD